MEARCKACKEEVETNNDGYECDECTDIYHLVCDNVSKKELTARLNSSRLKLICNECKTTKNAMAQNINTIMKFVHKIDFFSQKQEKNAE